MLRISATVQPMARRRRHERIAAAGNIFYKEKLARGKVSKSVGGEVAIEGFLSLVWWIEGITKRKKCAAINQIKYLPWIPLSWTKLVQLLGTSIDWLEVIGKITRKGFEIGPVHLNCTHLDIEE